MFLFLLLHSEENQIFYSQRKPFIFSCIFLEAGQANRRERLSPGPKFSGLFFFLGWHLVSLALPSPAVQRIGTHGWRFRRVLVPLRTRRQRQRCRYPSPPNASRIRLPFFPPRLPALHPQPLAPTAAPPIAQEGNRSLLPPRLNSLPSTLNRS